MPTIDLDSCSFEYFGIGAGRLPDMQRRGVACSGIRSDCRGVRVDVFGILYWDLLHHNLCLQMHSWMLIIGGDTNVKGAPYISVVSGVNCLVYHRSII